MARPGSADSSLNPNWRAVLLKRKVRPRARRVSGLPILRARAMEELSGESKAYKRLGEKIGRQKALFELRWTRQLREGRCDEAKRRRVPVASDATGIREADRRTPKNHPAVVPPSRAMTLPVIHEDSSEARNAA